MRAIRIAIPAWLCLSLLIASACGQKPPAPPPNAIRYELKGTVVGLAPERREVMIAHEAIPGYMEAMTMPFYVGRSEELKGLAPGDRVKGTLAIWPGNARLEKLEKRSK